MDAQLQIRQNALEAQDYMRDLLDWQQSMKQKAGSKSSKAPDQDVPAVRGKTVGSVHSPPEDLQQPAMQPSKAPAASAASPAAHTYAHYSKWDKYNPDAAADDDDQPPGVERQRPSRPQQQAPPTAPQQVQSTTAAANGTSKQAPAQASPPSATSLKDQGNKLFQQGQYLEAIQCYTQSIGLQATAVAYANRAMARLKLKQYAEAEQDCSAALQLDGSYIKALHRRGTARRQLGKLLEAAADFEEALRLEPGNATVRADRDAALEQHLQQQKIQPSTTWSSIPVLEQQQQRQEQGGQQQQQGQEVKQVSAPQQQLAQAASTGPDAATGSEPPSCSSGPVTAAAVDAVSSAVTGPDSSGPSGRPGGSRPPPAARSPSPQQASTAAAAAAAAAQLAARLAANLKAPKNSNEFEAAWRSFKGDAQLQVECLALGVGCSVQYMCRVPASGNSSSP